MQKAGSGATFYNVSFVGSKALADALGSDGSGVAISQVVPFPWGTSVPVVKEYQASAKKAGFNDYNFSAMEGFLTAKVMVEGLQPRRQEPDAREVSSTRWRRCRTSISAASTSAIRRKITPARSSST